MVPHPPTSKQTLIILPHPLSVHPQSSLLTDADRMRGIMAHLNNLAVQLLGPRLSCRMPLFVCPCERGGDSVCTVFYLFCYSLRCIVPCHVIEVSICCKQCRPEYHFAGSECLPVFLSHYSSVRMEKNVM